jgi:hypothetical protein
MSSAVPGESTPIAAVRQGMSVVDVAGERIGTVELVKMGDPEAVTPQGQTTGGQVSGMTGASRSAEPRVPAELASQLVRVGFVKVDGRGIQQRDVYVAAVQVKDVVDDVVRLGVSRTELLPGT